MLQEEADCQDEFGSQRSFSGCEQQFPFNRLGIKNLQRVYSWIIDCLVSFPSSQVFLMFVSSLLSPLRGKCDDALPATERQSSLQGVWSHGRGPHGGFVTHSSVSWPFVVLYVDLCGLHTESCGPKMTRLILI